MAEIGWKSARRCRMEEVKYFNLDRSKNFEKLKAEKPFSNLKEVLSRKRIMDYSIACGGGLTYNFAAKSVDDHILDLLQSLSEELQLIPKYRALRNGERINTGEDRMVLHHLLRNQSGNRITENGKDIGEFYYAQQKRVYDFADQVHSGKVRGSTGKQFTTVVQIGIGGSDLGPRALYLALENYTAVKMEALFISNVDPDDGAAVYKKIDPETTLFIIVSKSGTTQETLTNEAFITDLMLKDGIAGLDPSKHIVAVTSETSPLAKPGKYIDAFFFDDYIGGRYSATSPVGGVVLSLAFGIEAFAELLEGAGEADTLASEDNLYKNASLADALIGVYERNILGYPYTAVLPYSQALVRFPAHLQQLDMESNGKSVNRRGEEISYSTGPVVFGEPGTNGQHSFYQLLHQGTDVVPLQFIGFHTAQAGSDVDFQDSSSQKKLNANLAAQIAAFALGKEDSNPNKSFRGNRPSSLIYGPKLTPRALGALLAHFENKIMFQGFIWNVNSFDQEGVQLGKVLTKKVLSNDSLDEVLESYGEILGVL
jgi:glucose-6-phosphate isomerase